MGLDKLSAEQAKKLADELSTSSKLQSKALENGAYIRMSKEEAKEFDQRRTALEKSANC
jgi:polyhydroxyalkanoate synthesis regulator phasin